MKHLQPSKVTDRYWITAKRNIGDYPPSTERSGKWLVFVQFTDVDEVWRKISIATENGLLGGSAKVSTAMRNPNATDEDTKVICIYTYDWTDENDVRRVRKELLNLGITAKIPYKADETTLDGKYAKRGDKRISKYYE